MLGLLLEFVDCRSFCLNVLHLFFFHVETSPHGSKVGHDNNKSHTRIKKWQMPKQKKTGTKITLLPIGKMYS